MKDMEVRAVSAKRGARRSATGVRLLVHAALIAVSLGALFATTSAAERRAAAAMTEAATRFLAGLTAEQQAQAAFPLTSDERLRWHYIPTGQPPTSWPRQGVPLKAMTPAQKDLARDLLKASLSGRGYVTATAIMDLEMTLRAIETASGSQTALERRNPEMYFFTVFGEPSSRAPWGFRAEGHHLSLHFTVVNGELIASAPSFFGASPAEVREGPKAGLRVLGPREDAGRALLESFDETQRKTALITDTAPLDVVTGNKAAATPLAPLGIEASAFTPRQRDLLLSLIDVHASDMADDIARERVSRLTRAGIEKISFAWAGETARGQKHYYRVQGPTFLIEYDNTQNDANHIHSVWRDFDGDFGADILRAHLKSQPH